MIQIALTVMKFFLMIFGDALLAKWVTAFRIWYRELTDPILKKKLEEDYQRTLAEWDDYRRDRQGIHRP